MIKKISDKDKIDWEKFIKSKEKLPNKDYKYTEKNTAQIKKIDLHGFNLIDANEKIEKFINTAFEENIKKIIVITGKGLHSQNDIDPYISKDFGILKYSVPEFLKKNKNLMKIILRIDEATINDGGSGAFYIYLKKNNKWLFG